MGFFDRFGSKKPGPTPTPVTSEAAPASVAANVVGGGGVIPRLTEARAKLEAKDLAGALAIYEEVLAAAGERADVLVTISGDLGSNGHVAQIAELIAPRYDAERHGPATGLNLLQAYLALRQPDAAQHVLDILFSLNRPELEERLHGFSNAIADLMAQGVAPVGGSEGDGVGAPTGAPKVALITIGKPIWFYGLEPLAAKLLPAKDGKLRRIAFAQLAVPGAHKDFESAMKAADDELGRLSRALPTWFAETFYFSTLYAPIVAVGMLDQPGGGKQPMAFGAEWTIDNLRQLVDSTEGGLDYVVTGALRQTAGDFELLLRVWEVKKFRERKQFLARWTPATANEELGKVHATMRAYMEWAPAAGALAYAPPAAPMTWLEMLSASLSLFLVDKKLLTVEQLPPLGPLLDTLAPEAATNATTSLAWLTLMQRIRASGTAPPIMEVQLSFNPLVKQAKEIAG